MPEASVPGYVYLLINRSMPGMVKVGRTTRDPMERLEELSASTGVPTPFELVFDILVADCEATEARLHGLLEQHGFRVAENREFFRAPIHEVVKMMLLLRESDSRPRLAALSSSSPARSYAAPADDPNPLLRDAARAVLQAGEGSTSVIQRHLSVGYVRATRILDQLEALGILGAREGPHPREVLINCDQLDQLLPAS